MRVTTAPFVDFLNCCITPKNHIDLVPCCCTANRVPGFNPPLRSVSVSSGCGGARCSDGVALNQPGRRRVKFSQRFEGPAISWAAFALEASVPPDVDGQSGYRWSRGDRKAPDGRPLGC